MRKVLMVGLISLTAAACAAGTSTGATAGTGSAAAVSRKPNLITREEIAVAQAENPSAYDIIVKLRPNYLKNRGVTSPGTGSSDSPVVYLDNVRFGGLDTLRDITSKSLISIQYLSGTDATTRFGMDHGGGAIMVYTR